METRGPTEPPQGPAPSLWPLGFAIGITVALVGLVIGSWSAVAVGAVLLLAFGFLWARDVATGMQEPPPAVADDGPSGTTDGEPGQAVMKERMPTEPRSMASLKKLMSSLLSSRLSAATIGR